MKQSLFEKLRTYKDKLYFYFAVKNWGVGREYGPYKDSHPGENPWRLRCMLLRLNVHYRVLRRKDYLYLDPDHMVPAPYRNGAESESVERPFAFSLAMDLVTYDVISFDVFDTLLLCPFAHPADLFLLVGKRLRNDAFPGIRVECEEKARQAAFAEKGSREVTLDDIYALIEERTGISRETGIRAELDAQFQYCFASPYMRQVFELLRERGRTLVITADTCLPRTAVERLLHACGYNGFEKVYLSCDCGAGKADGHLYDRIKADFPDQKIVHVGDDFSSDGNAAKQKGLDVRHRTNCHEIGNRYRADGMSALIGSAYSGIVNTHLHGGTKTYSAEYEYGFIYGGLYVLGFCGWLHRKAKAEGVDRLLFLAADGGIYQRVFNHLFDDIPCKNLLWPGSRNGTGRQLQRYLSSRIEGARKVAVVDVGWRNTCPLELKHRIEKNLDCAVLCWEALSDMPEGTVEAYLFSPTENRDNYEFHALANDGRNHAYFELFTRDAAPAFLGISGNGRFCFDTPDIARYGKIHEIHQGIFDFCSLYRNTFRQDPFMLNIDGRDAYIPFRMAVRDTAYIRGIMADMGTEEQKSLVG